MDKVSLVSRIVSTISCNTFFGAALYVNIVETPARLAQSTAPAMVKHFQETFPRAMAMQGKLAGLTSIGSLVSWWTQDHKHGYLLLCAGVSMLFALPWTKIVIMPINHQLMDGDTPVRKGEGWVADMMKRWNRVHAVRSCCSGVAMLCLLSYWILRAEA